MGHEHRGAASFGREERRSALRGGMPLHTIAPPSWVKFEVEMQRVSARAADISAQPGHSFDTIMCARVVRDPHHVELAAREASHLANGRVWSVPVEMALLESTTCKAINVQNQLLGTPRDKLQALKQTTLMSTPAATCSLLVVACVIWARTPNTRNTSYLNAMSFSPMMAVGAQSLVAI
ncbi:uncharacterized protein J7T54_002095 [Emericellopsis cladophorae]|uniref:Uncharacterized protein n=1 Tax=Emericellopsis cladophorae TaxID=2686198 RepID=A0A9P9Y3Q2_9HYPO|nr:uncharacterized protein J7T54_002095 [Emericellopsis cladophorae]KAI6782936.1 hypothetical protein J7T54_002095 [Emericellopsis cladophorae]